MSQCSVSAKQPHPAFHRAMSDVSYYLSVAIVFCPDESTSSELISAHESIGKLYKDLIDKINTISSDGSESAQK